MVKFRTLKDRTNVRTSKRNQARAVEKDSVGNVSLWEGRGKVSLNGTVVFGDYKDPDSVKYNLILFDSDDDKKYVCSGLITIPSEPVRTKRRPGQKSKREQQVGRVYLYEGKASSAYLMLFLGLSDEDDTEVFNCPLTESTSDNPKAPIYIGELFESQNPNHVERDKERIKRGTKALAGTRKRDKSDDWYGPEDIIEIVDTYSREQIDELFSLLIDGYFGGGLLQEVINYCEAKQKSDWVAEEEKEDEPEFEVLDESDDDDDEEEVNYGDGEYDYSEKEQEEDENEQMPTLKLNLGREKKSRISDVVKGKTNRTLKRTASNYLADIDDTDIEEIL